MPDSWDAEKYRQRAEEWQKKAESLGEGKERTACLTIAEGYARLAETIENRSRQYSSTRSGGCSTAGSTTDTEGRTPSPESRAEDGANSASGSQRSHSPPAPALGAAWHSPEDPVAPER